MGALRWFGLGCVLLIGAACGGGGGDGEGDTWPPCPAGPFLSVCPVDAADLSSLLPLGNLNPPGHVFPSGHMGLMLRVVSGELAPVVTTLYAPGDLLIVRATASEHVHGGYTDYSVTLAACREITFRLGHITSLEPSIFGDPTTRDGWTLGEEYSTGGETYRNWFRDMEVPVTAGTILGTVGGRFGQWGVDFGAFDQRGTTTTPANPARWENGPYLSCRCALEFFVPGPVADEMWARVSRVGPPDDPHPCGAILQDVPGTAQGCWFVAGTTQSYPEDPHLALVYSHRDADAPVISMGTSVANVHAQTHTFSPLDTGRRNRPFTAVVPDGQNYGYLFPPLTGVLVVHMPDASTLWVEHVTDATSNPTTWVFTGARTVFER